MTKNLIITCILLAFSILINKAFAQQTNSKEDYSAYLPEMRAFNQHLLHDTTMLPPDTSIRTQLQPSVKYIQGLAGNIGLRIFKPKIIRGVVMDIHGGGRGAGIAAFDDSLNDVMARICKVAVVSVDYRLAPENPFPACINDCNTAASG